ncbi:hypothetical protein CK203_053395 [Vitis vinifera]|uniref:Uncharacterized protein n=1 Tax=Vitis vinifera TaxID=29760 RepID=A0A438GZM0_VITVI|nr:hypothetical protein CK203_053395 [Vitis vinifera]
MRSLHVTDGVMSWDGYDDLPIAALPIEFLMLDIERCTGIGCPCIHLQLYSVVMRRHRLDETQMIMLFPLSLSGAGPVVALYGIEEGISRGLWVDSSPSNSKGKSQGQDPGYQMLAPLDGEAPQLISLYEDSDFSGYTHGQQVPRPFRLAPNEIPLQPAVSLVYLQHVPPLTPFIMFPEGYGPAHRDVQIVTRSGRVAHPPLVDRPFVGTVAREEIRREDDEILRQLRTTQAHISIWSLLASSSTHRDALIRALSHIRVDTATIPEGLIHFLTADRATCIVFSNDDLPLERSDHVQPLFIDVACSGRRVSSVLLDNGSAVNVCPLVTAIALGFSHPLTRFFVVLGFMRLVPYQLSFIRRLHSYGGGCTLHGVTTQGQKAVEVQDLQRTLGHMHLGIGIPETPDVMIVAPLITRPSQHVLLTLPNACTDEMDMIGVSHILDAVPHGPHSDFDLFGVSVIDTNDVTLYDASTNEMDIINTRASDSMDPPLSFDIMSGFVTRFDDVASGNNNNMSVFEYSPVSLHFPLIVPSTPMTYIHDVDDHQVGRFGTPDQPRELKIGTSLSPDERNRVIDLLRSYLDVFAWSYKDMPGLDPSIAQHRLPILPHARPVKQKLRRLHPRWSLQVKKEIQKQLSVGFLLVVKYPEWLANVVHVPKKDGKVRVCVDFQDLNKVSPKDDFPLPHIDILVDSTGTYYYLVMPFGLKNVGAAYQRAATTLFHDMMHRDVDVYVDDMIVKSQDRADHLATLQRFFERIKQFRLTDICEPICRLLRKSEPRVWDDDCQCTFKKIKECLVSSPVLVPPTPGRHLLMYLSISDIAMGCMLAQLDDSGKDRTIYYLSKRTLKYECRYIMIECLCLALFGHQKLRHYAHEMVSATDRSVDDDFPDEQFVLMTSIAGWRLYFDGATNQSGFGIGILLISPQGLETTLDLGVRQLEIHGDSNLVIQQTQKNQSADALATLAFVIEIHAGVTMRPLLIRPGPYQLIVV